MRFWLMLEKNGGFRRDWAKVCMEIGESGNDILVYVHMPEPFASLLNGMSMLYHTQALKHRRETSQCSSEVFSFSLFLFIIGNELNK